ncbi:MAG: aldehyde dehydrogenase family protein [Betaproteobacteria bacterium]
MVPAFRMLIDGAWDESSDQSTFERRSPFDGASLATYANGTTADADRAIIAARRTFDSGVWRNIHVSKRTALLRRVAARLRESAEEIGRGVTEEVGQPVGKGMTLAAADYIDYYAEQAFDLRGGSITEHAPNAMGIIAKEPIGVVGIITPWNAPIVISAWKMAGALAVGCSVVIKPAHFAPRCVLQLARIFQDEGLPPGVLNVLTSDQENGSIVGQHIAASPLVDMITFTGSSATGQKIMVAAASNLKRVSFELGGKSPNIVFDDVASLDAAVAGAFAGMTGVGGQSCQSGSRLLIHRPIQEAFVEKLVEKVETSVKLGNPVERTTTMGPMVSEAQQRKILSYIESGKECAQLRTGGGKPVGPEFDRGHFVQPTVFNNVDNRARIAQEEIFGPVLSVIPFDDESEAIALANDTIFGLSSAIWTENLNRALRVAKGIRAGVVWINSYRNSPLFTMPFGGYKQSGIGREMGREGLDEFLETKSIHIKVRGENEDLSSLAPLYGN